MSGQSGKMVNPGGLHDSTVLLGITGSISAASMPAFVFELRQRGVRSIDIIVSRSAAQFVQAQALAAFSRCQTYLDGDDLARRPSANHVELTRRAGIFVIMPASANILGKAAHGIADTLLSTALVAATCPVLFVPSMNSSMWTNVFVQHNVGILRDAGHTVLDPGPGTEVGSLALTAGGMASTGQVLYQMGKALTGRTSPAREAR